MEQDNSNSNALKRESFQEAKDKLTISDININDIRESHLRCGEVYMDGTENFKFVCMLCEKSFFTNIGEFIIHVTNCESTTEYLKSESVEVVDIERVILKEELTSVSSDVDTENSVFEDPVRVLASSHNESEDSETHKLENTDTNGSARKETQNIFSCNYCDKKYLHNDSLKRHLKQAHCENSIKKTTNEQNEIRRIPRRGQFPCNYCDKKYSNKDSFRRHLKEKHPENVEKESTYVKCDYPNCNCKFRSKESFEVHKNYDHKAVYMLVPNSKQNNEELEYDKTESFEKNSTNVNQDGKFDDHNCRFCGRCFISILDRYEHERIHTGIKPYKCRFCDKYSRTEHLRNVHELIHKGVKPYKCHLCDFAFIQKQNLKAHIKRHFGQKNLPCRFCGKLFFVNSERNKHEKIHTGEKPFQCSDCGECYYTLSALNVHIKKKHSTNSTNVNKFKCDLCGKLLSSRSGLKRHCLTHSGEKSFKCEMCNVKFLTNNGLRQHKKIHSNIFGYICKICGKGFKQRPGLYGHMKSHGVVST